MAKGEDVSARVLKTVQQSPGCDLDEIVVRCPGITWNQVFLALDGLSRSGQVQLKQRGPGHYRMTVWPEKPVRHAHASQYA